jgi:iron complex transport system substrate-binding protein
MVACSFLPAATQMIYDMGLQHLLKGVTFECMQQARNENEIIVRCMLEGNNYSSQEIDKIFSASKAQGKSLYYVEDDKLQALSPDVIFTQDVCEVCQIDTKCTQEAIHKLKKQPQLIPLTPQSLDDVFNTAITIAKALGHEENAYTYLASQQKRIDYVIDQLRHHKALPKRAMVMEWIDPIYNCGHWIPHQVAYAGGIDMLGNPSGDSIVTSWDKIVKYNPEVLVIAPCGFHIERAAQEMHLLTKKVGWQELEAVKNSQVHIADFDLFTQPSPGTLTDGIELLASLFHPKIFDLPAHLKVKTKLYSGDVLV